MNILYIGDIMGAPGREIVREVLPGLVSSRSIDFVIAQSENVSHGVSMTPAHMKELQSYGVEAFTGGNHTYKKAGIHDMLKDDSQPVIGPANLPVTPGKGYKYVTTPNGDVRIISILGSIFPLKDGEAIDNPLQTIDRILEAENGHRAVATIVNFHGDWSSEKIVFGQYLDGRVSAVIGDHWHVHTGDARVLPSRTAYISDVGMTGALNSCLGVKSDLIIARWRDGIKNKNELEDARPYQFNALLIDVDTATGLARSVEHIHIEK